MLRYDVLATWKARVLPKGCHGSFCVNQNIDILCIHSWLVVSFCSNQLRTHPWSDNTGKVSPQG
jgi:hypothetical protein